MIIKWKKRLKRRRKVCLVSDKRMSCMYSTQLLARRIGMKLTTWTHIIQRVCRDQSISALMIAKRRSASMSKWKTKSWQTKIVRQSIDLEEKETGHIFLGQLLRDVAWITSIWSFANHRISTKTEESISKRKRHF